MALLNLRLEDSERLVAPLQAVQIWEPAVHDPTCMTKRTPHTQRGTASLPKRPGPWLGLRSELYHFVLCRVHKTCLFCLECLDVISVLISLLCSYLWSSFFANH